jgi:hypothetical protein
MVNRSVVIDSPRAPVLRQTDQSFYPANNGLRVIHAADAKHPNIRLAISGQISILGLCNAAIPVDDIGEETMQSRQSPTSNLPYRRIDAIQMSTSDREQAKAQLQAAERFVDGIHGAGMAIGACAASAARYVRTFFAVSPQH